MITKSKLKEILLEPLVLFTLIALPLAYTIGAFTSLSLNPFEWGGMTRFFLSLFIIYSVIMGGVFSHFKRF